MTADFDIVGIGVCTVDHIMTVPRLPQRNENMRALNYSQQPGGLASCALAAAARLGAKTKIIARIGDDQHGDFIRRDLLAEGVDVSQLLVAPNSESHVSLILVDEATGERSIMTRLPTGPPIAATEIQREDITCARLLFIDNINEVTLQAARWAQEAGMTVVLDPSRPFAEIAPLLPYVDVPIVPEAWVRAWRPGQPLADAIYALHEFGARIAIVTLGERGAIAAWNRQTRAFPAYAVDVVDTTGAGDAYHGAFMVALLQDDWQLPRMAQFAAAVGALNCRAIGGRSALPSRAQVEDFIATNPFGGAG